MRHDTLFLWFLGDPASPRYVGTLQLVASGKGVSLHYGAEWLANGFALSEDLPLIDIEHLPRGRLATDTPRAVGAVDDARPDRWGERVIQYIDKPKRLSLMEYLYYAGDDRFGALGVSTSSDSYQPRTGGPLPRLNQAQALSEVVHKVAAREPITDVERKVFTSGGSFGGAKPKALIEIDGEQWVIKFFNGEPVDVPLIEHATMLLAQKAGIRTAETRIVPLQTENAIAVKRFDRMGKQRIHSISAGTALRAASAAEPDLGYPALAQLLRRSGAIESNESDSRELFRRMVFNILIDNTDDHEKNHALMVVEPNRNGRLRLSPAYDVVPTNSGQGHQEFICGDQGRESTLINAMSQCRLFGLNNNQATAEVMQVINVVNGWRAHFRDCGVTAIDIDNLAERIDSDELRIQRESFSAEQFANPVKRKPPRGPFQPN
jgi:serine/threonine-protein kinase HipA